MLRLTDERSRALIVDIRALIVVLLVLNPALMFVVVRRVDALRVAVEQSDDARARAEDLRRMEWNVALDKSRAMLTAEINGQQHCRPGWYEGIQQATEDRARGAAIAVSR